jgi:hypothetical protein
MPQEHADDVLKAVTKQHLCVETSEESLDSRRRIIECFYCSMMISCEPFCHFLPKKKIHRVKWRPKTWLYTPMELWKQQVIPTFS